MTDFDYRQYSLTNLEKWLHDAISCNEATPQEIYNVIKNTVNEEYYTYKYHTGRCYELLALLNGNGRSFNIDPAGNNVDDMIFSQEFETGKSWDMLSTTNDGNLNDSFIFDINDKSCENKKSWSDFWNDSLEYNSLANDIIREMQEDKYSDEELNAMCEKAELDQKKENKKNNKSKTLKYQLPIEVDGLTGECCVILPEELLELANLKEGDDVEWISQNDGSWILKKVA